MTGHRVIAITAPDSFLGRNLIRRFSAAPEVDRIVGIGRQPPPIEIKKLQYEPLDLTDPKAMGRLVEIFRRSKVDTVYHFDVMAWPTQNTEWAHELHVLGSSYVMNAAGDTGVSRFIFHSTTAVYGARADNPNFLGERHGLRGQKGKGFFTDKVEAESAASKFHHKHPAMTFIVYRLATLLGPHVDNFMTRYFRLAAVPTVMGYDPLMQFISERDAVDAYALAADLEGTGRVGSGTYNIVGRGVVPVGAALRLMRKTRLPIPLPAFESMVRLSWNAQVGPFPPYFTNYLRYLWVADGAKAETELGFKAKDNAKTVAAQFAGLLPTPDDLF